MGPANGLFPQILASPQQAYLVRVRQTERCKQTVEGQIIQPRKPIGQSLYTRPVPGRIARPLDMIGWLI